MKQFFRVTLMVFLLLSIASFAQVGSKGIAWASGSSGLDFIDDASILLEKQIKVNNSKFLKRVYKDLFYTPIWIEEKGVTRFGTDLLDKVGSDKTLDPAMKSKKLYIKLIEKLKATKEKKGGTLQDKVNLEFDFATLYKVYSDYLIYGGINWTSFKAKLATLKKSLEADFGWIVYKPKTDPVSLLNSAVAKGELGKVLNNAEPKRFKYKKLKKFLIKYIEIKQREAWKSLPKFLKKIKAGKQSKAIPMIRNNLALEGDLGSCRGDMGSETYDECLVKAVKRFQLRNGFKSDGIIGKGTYSALDTPVAKKIKLIRLNLDRIKRLRNDEANARIELNIPSFRLQFYDGKRLVDTMRVVVGKPNHPTPSFGHTVQYIVVNPWWKIPESIVKKEMLRHLVKDPYYYERRGKVLHATWSEDSKRIDPGTINWSKYRSSDAHIPYRFMQVPSRRNALGKIKFIFPNQFSVYIHDTPSKKLFFKTNRAFSHGCMRIQKPRDMLKAIALFNDNIDVDAIMKRLQGTEKKTIGLKTKIPIDITYLTAFVDDYGNLNFRKDVYSYDKYMLKDYQYRVDKYNKKKKSIKKGTKLKKTKKSKSSDGYQISEVYPKKK